MRRKGNHIKILWVPASEDNKLLGLAKEQTKAATHEDAIPQAQVSRMKSTTLSLEQSQAVTTKALPEDVERHIKRVDAAFPGKHTRQLSNSTNTNSTTTNSTTTNSTTTTTNKPSWTPSSSPTSSPRTNQTPRTCASTLTSTSHQKTPLLDGSTIPPASHHPFAASPPSYPVPMHELTSRGTISDYSQRSYGSISSASSADSAGSYSHATRRPSDLLAQHPCSYPPDRETVEQQKRERFLERSRVAANKCRRKKKKHMRQLKSKCMDVTQANTRLESEVSQLRSQILELKNELLQHSGLSTPSASVVSTGASESDMVLSGGVSRRAESVASLWEANSEKVEEAAFGFKDMVVLPAAAAGGSKVGEGKQEDADADADAEPVKMTEGP
ncbi:bZIP transcription factor [Aspergillus vadensis CBS 113365]|uniref:BZIP domain-containing protein n=1 Tax=Aspergillus vadensis (strain CBS 113365 / IMI 142717 / IBT 24658) TaxID=1448311 RepID=A0A319B3G2_ASPVC|nr:hypothetical protein BO88DRAFT_489418 [Aspergillus vadensis CBS 113365]PYH67049.1 hypothetical protein BO88DRAFT_489418 [Aspergillus vadensis CBS 113365]